jgi:hypothetical protein
MRHMRALLFTHKQVVIADKHMLWWNIKSIWKRNLPVKE